MNKTKVIKKTYEEKGGNKENNTNKREVTNKKY